MMSVQAFALSPLQLGMLFHWLLDRHSGTDIEQIVADLNETIDPARMAQAWRHALNAFAVLRTRFVWESLATPQQYVVADVEFVLAVRDLRSLEAQKREEAISQYLRSDRHDGFDLTRAPAMRVALFQLAEGNFRMVWTFHHILIDGRSFETILNEVFGHYEDSARQPPADRSYRDYIDWVTDQDTHRSREFWRETLAGYTATTPIPEGNVVLRDAPRFGQIEAALSERATLRLREMAVREQLSLNTVVMAAWALLLFRHGGEQDVVFGTTKTTRRGTIAGAESMVGLFLATIPLRIAVDPALPVVDWLRAVRARWTELRGNEHLPLVEIKQCSELPPSLPLFNSLVVFENYRFGTRLHRQGGDWAKRRFRILEQTNFPLTLLAYADDALALKIEYDARRFDSPAIHRMLGSLLTVLEAWAESVDLSLAETPLLTQAERRTILRDWNQTAAYYPRATSLAELIETQVEATPDAPAVTFDRTTVSYRELNELANRLARRLQRHGIGPGRLVGIAIERGIDLMVSLVAVIKSGAAYVPLDPRFPRDRLAHMVQDGEIGVLITQQRLHAQFPSFSGVTIDVDVKDAGSDDAGNLKVEVAADDLAYVIYTSGSTGQPKGVQISRGALTNLLWSMRAWLAPTASDRLLAVTTISFDIAAVDVWLPLIVGAHTVLASEAAAADGSELRELLDKHDITLLQATPVTWRLLLEAGWQGRPTLQAICTGEAFPLDLAHSLLPAVGVLWNLYGPTETTIWSTGCQLHDLGERVPIGRPISNTRCYILDDRFEPVPIGAIGELFIAGDGLARGYLKRSDLDIEKFLLDPFASDQTARMYRTGDLARYHEDGTIECLGRTDHQVKIRGYRIELGEIENVLTAHADVRQAVAVAREDAPGDKRLVAYVLAEADSFDANQLRAYMKQALPEYMVPAAVVRLDAMPLTANGKIDRRALPVPDDSAVGSRGAKVVARTHVERQLSEIWEELFGLREVDVTDDFFDLGGHSLLAVKVIGRIRRVFGKQLPLNALFEAPTIAQLASYIDVADRTVGQHTVVSIQEAGSRPPIFWVPGGAALGLFRLRHVVTRLGPEQPVYGLGSARPAFLADVETVEKRAGKYLELVRRVRPHGPYCLAGFCAGGLVAFEMAQQLRAAGEEIVFLGLINCEFPNYPAGKLDQALMRAQRLHHQVRGARDRGVGIVKFAVSKFMARHAAQRERSRFDSLADEVSRSGLHDESAVHDQLLLDTVALIFARYVPRKYDGAVALFIADADEYAGVSRRLDPRYAWVEQVGASDIRHYPGGHDILPAMELDATFTDNLKSALDSALRRFDGSVHAHHR